MKNLLNKITLGDAYTLIKQVPDKSIDLIYTDIPYLIITGGGSNGRIGARVKAMQDQLKHISKGIDYSIFDDFIRVSKLLNCYIWCSRLQVPDILNYFISKGYLFDIFVWCKTNPIPATKNIWLSDIEYCLYFRDKGVRFNNSYDLKSKWFISSINQRDKAKYWHPTIKPMELVTRHIQHTLPKEDSNDSRDGMRKIILDPFAGSGTTALAAQNLGHDYIAFENNKKWHGIATDRLNGIRADGQIAFFAS
ncbi:MAG: site-specific DNA-methyltransferase [Firmicutes bacterium]|nr:site-specific DNA-methyltransferase [Bacillota bacterium]